MKYGLVAFACSLVAVAGCAPRRLPDGTMTFRRPGLAVERDTGGATTVVIRTPYPIVPGLNFTVEADRRALAAVLVNAFDTRGGMDGVADDVQACYAAAEDDRAHGGIFPSEFRFCVLYDAVAYRIDRARVQTYGHRGSPYFDPILAGTRWTRHILKAGQGRKSELDAFLTKGAMLTVPLLPLSRLNSAR